MQHPGSLGALSIHTVSISPLILWKHMCIANFNLKCNMHNGNAICKMAKYISVFKFLFSHTYRYVQHLVQNENEII